MTVKLLVALVVILAAARLLLVLFERINLYFPTRRLEATPAAIGLDYEDVTIRTRDGVRLNAWFVPAAGSRRAVLFFHGNAGNISHRLDTLRIFHTLGLNTLIVDYRGYGRSEGRPGEKGIYLDAEAAYDYLSRRPEVDPETLVAFGRSLGGAVAVELARRRKLAGLISESAFSSTADIARGLFPFLPVRALVTQEFDSASKVGSLSLPKLFIHSRDDEMIPFSHSVRLFEAAADPKKLREMRGRHNEAFLLPENRYAETLRAFLDELPPRPSGGRRDGEASGRDRIIEKNISSGPSL